MNKFVDRLTELIALSGKTQNELCKTLGVSKQKLSKWKLGHNEPNMDELLLIASVFGVSCDYLLGARDY